MAVVAAKREVGIKKTGQSCTVPDNPKANLMYYLSCVSSVLDLHDNQHISRLTNYKQYHSLDDDDTDVLLTLVVLFSPDELIGKVFHPSEDIDGSSNEFYEISAVSHLLAATSNVVIGGQTRQVLKIMLFKKCWMEENYIRPIIAFKDRLARLAGKLSGGRSRPAITSSSSASYSTSRTSSDDSCCCTIL